MEGNTHFALDLYQDLRKTPGNIFFSPYSISTAMGMVYTGARGNTARQIADTFHFPSDPAKLHADVAELESALASAQKKSEHVRFFPANSIWPQKGLPLLPAYIETLKKVYKVSVTPLDFKTNAAGTRDIINAWVEGKTEKKIPELIPEKGVGPATKMVLCNAVYFRGRWHEMFEPESTVDGPFFSGSGNVKQVPYMNSLNSFEYFDNADLQMTSFNYDLYDLSMVVLLPRAKDGLAALEEKFTPTRLGEWIKGLDYRKVVVALPKFKLESEFELGKKLAAMGMPDAFDPAKSDFSGMDGASPTAGKGDWLTISEVRHKAFVEVNENGTEAAAATAIEMGAGSRMEDSPPPVFRADHPFLFFIRENKTNELLFIGRVVNP